MAVNNHQQLPVSSDGHGLKSGTRVGEGAIRDVAAYLLDHPKIGPRCLSNEVMGLLVCHQPLWSEAFTKCMGVDNCCREDAKVGSLQMFMKNNGSCEDIGPGAFPVEEVHKISVFEIRMANADRHAGNILSGKGEDGITVLIPIDHGYCLPENSEDCTFEWLYWPQAKVLFSADTLDYINLLDAEQDIALRQLNCWNVPEAVARTFRISTMLLKKRIERKLTPYQIGSIMCRETVNKESAIEEIVREAHHSVFPAPSETTFLEDVSITMERRLDGLTK